MSTTAAPNPLDGSGDIDRRRPTKLDTEREPRCTCVGRRADADPHSTHCDQFAPIPAPLADRVPTHRVVNCEYCNRYNRACGRHEALAGQDPHAAYYAAKGRVLDALSALGAKSRDTAVDGPELCDHGGESLLADAQAVSATGAEVKYRLGYGYWLGGTRNNGRA